MIHIVFGIPCTQHGFPDRFRPPLLDFLPKIALVAECDTFFDIA
jgi:hypothetical protein